MNWVLVYVIGWFKSAINEWGISICNEWFKSSNYYDWGIIYVIGWFKSAINDKIWMGY